MFILHVNNDVISDMTREHNVSKVHVICYNLVPMLVFYCNFLQEKYLLSWNLLNVPRTYMYLCMYIYIKFSNQQL